MDSKNRFKARRWLIFSFLYNALTYADSPPISPQPKFGVDELKLHRRELPARFDECHLCHTKKNRKFIKKDPHPQREHSYISSLHGARKMSCNMCHDINNHNYLIKSARFPADFTNPSPVCAKCHNEKFRDWKRGLHGKRTGGWIKPQVQFHCIDCHNPHHVPFPSMESVVGPKLSPSVIRNENENKGH